MAVRDELALTVVAATASVSDVIVVEVVVIMFSLVTILLSAVVVGAVRVVGPLTTADAEELPVVDEVISVNILSAVVSCKQFINIKARARN